MIQRGDVTLVCDIPSYNLILSQKSSGNNSVIQERKYAKGSLF